MKVPPKRKGNVIRCQPPARVQAPSKKVPPKRKGNPLTCDWLGGLSGSLNESPSEKEGKFYAPTNALARRINPQ